MATNNNNNEINWTEYNTRSAQNKKTDILNVCCNREIPAGVASQILFAAGYSIKASRILNFYAGRAKWIAESKAKAAIEQAAKAA